MITGSPNIVIPHHVSHMVRVFENNEPPKDNPIPVYWDCFLVYFKATRRYYSGITCRFGEYLAAINNPNCVRYKALPKALLKQLKNSTDIQFIVTSRSMRNDVEAALSKIGVLRIATKMGEGDSGPKALFSVYSPYYKVTRFIVTEESATSEEIVKTANIGFAYWLRSASQQNHHLRITLRTATNSLKEINTQVFKEDAVVTRVSSMSHIPVNMHRQISIDENINAAKRFLLATTGVR